MNRKITAIIICFFLLIGGSGCHGMGSIETTFTSNDLVETSLPPNDSVTSSPPPIQTNNSVEMSLTPIVVNDPLLNLSIEDFEREYAKLPDDYRIMVGDPFNFNDIFYTNYTESVSKDDMSEFLSDTMNNSYEDENDELKMVRGTITKKQAQQIVSLDVGSEDADEDGEDMSLIGLRYFPNIEKIRFSYSSLSDMKELGYLSNLKKVSFYDCNLGITSTNELKGLSKMKKINIMISSCKLEDINFLKHFSDLNGGSFDFSDNQIKDISPLSKLKNVSSLDLSYNKIENIRPLSNLKRVKNLDLSGNKISDLTPLANIEKINELWLRDNTIRDFGILSKLKKTKRLKKYYH